MSEQRTEEWFQKRSGKITASNADVLLMKPTTAGYRNYMIRLALERINGKPFEEGYKSFAMQQGTEREPVARSAYEVSAGEIVEEVDFIEHPIMKYAGCSPDGLVGVDGGLEIKCPEHAAHFRYLIGTGCPDDYKPQVQFSLMVTGRKWWDFVTFNPDFPEALQFKVIRVERDEDYIKVLKQEAVNFNAGVEALVKQMQDMMKGK
jgi:putative phage-type endonuclease